MGPYGPSPSGNVIPEPVRNRVNGGKNERCEGNVCTLTHRFSWALKEGQKIDLLNRARFVAPGRSFEFNGVKICEIEVFSKM